MTTITAETILRSRNKSKPDQVLSTLLLRYPRCVHAELMTHRVFSRNSASSRAIPNAKLMKDIKENPFVPRYWGQNQKGMQAGEENDSGVVVDGDLYPREHAWRKAMESAVSFSEGFADADYHKQIVNRLAEPFMHITVLVSSTEWSNWIGLRDHPDAEPHIRDLAIETIKQLRRTDNIHNLSVGDWHLPFITKADWNDVDEYIAEVKNLEPTNQRVIEMLIKKSCACSASTSYKTVDGFGMDFSRSEFIFDKLAGSRPMHASPFEHVAYADAFIKTEKKYIMNPLTKEMMEFNVNKWNQSLLHGNFEGFCQYRKLMPNESM